MHYKVTYEEQKEIFEKANWFASAADRAAALKHLENNRYKYPTKDDLENRMVAKEACRIVREKTVYQPLNSFMKKVSDFLIKENWATKSGFLIQIKYTIFGYDKPVPFVQLDNSHIFSIENVIHISPFEYLPKTLFPACEPGSSYRLFLTKANKQITVSKADVHFTKFGMVINQ